MTSSAVYYPTGNSLLFASPYHPFASNFVGSSPGSKIWEFQYLKDDASGTPITTRNEWKFLPLPPLNFDADKESAGSLTTAIDDLESDEQQQQSSFNTTEVDYPINDGGPSHNSPIEVSYQDSSGVDSDVCEWFEWVFSTSDPSSS
jgi:hypothetical protein